MTNDMAIRELERLRQREINETPEADPIMAGQSALAILALDAGAAALRSQGEHAPSVASVTPETRRLDPPRLNYIIFDLLGRIERRAHNALIRNAHGHMCEFRQEIDAILSLAKEARHQQLHGLSPVSEATQNEEKNKEDGAPLLPADPLASPPTTETLPFGEDDEDIANHCEVNHKAHYPRELRCAWCGEAIPGGESHAHNYGYWQGEKQDWRMHAECYTDADLNGALDAGFMLYEAPRPQKIGSGNQSSPEHSDAPRRSAAQNESPTLVSEATAPHEQKEKILRAATNRAGEQG